MTPTLAPEQALLATDRCDRCSAQAYVRVTLSAGGDLLFCGHHFREHEDRLRPLALRIQDETDRLATTTAIVED
ncbi:MAG TPA: hypothetical protein VIC82_14275 [Candidatus Nanopelagicales bacterium]|jgi:hypothetical protein